MKLYVIDRSVPPDRSKMQFDVVWEGVTSNDDETIELITSFEPSMHPIRHIMKACTAGITEENRVKLEDETQKALRKSMGQAFLGGFCDGYQEHCFSHTAEAVYLVTATTTVSDDAINPITKYYTGDPTELVHLLSLLLAEIRIKGFIKGWRIFLIDTGAQQPDTRQWLMAMDFTPLDLKKGIPPQPQHGIEAQRKADQSMQPRSRS